MTIEEFNVIRKEEGDNYFFTYKGFNCEIKRHPQLWHLCGYIDIPLDSRYYKGEDYDDYDFVNQEATYGKIKSEMDESVYRVRFDCAHYGQLVPSLLMNDRVNHDIYWTKEHCIETILDTIDHWIEQSE